MNGPAPARVPPSLYLGVSLTSLGVLLLQISLTRIFSFTIWYHFAYVTISVALLGFGAAGSVLAAFPRLLAHGRARVLAVAAALGAAAVGGMLMLLAHLTLDPMRVFDDPRQLFVLVVYYLAVALPFFLAGLCISGALTALPAAVSRLYCFDLVGAGAGCALAVAAIWWLGTPGAAVGGGVCLAAAAVLFGWEASPRYRFTLALAGVAIAATLVAGLAGSLEFRPNRGKFLAMLLDTPGAEHRFRRWTPVSRIDLVQLATTEGSYVKVGISPTFDGTRPQFSMVSNDGDSCAVVYRFSGDLDEMELFRRHVLRAPYVLLAEPRVLVIGLGGGADILNALVNGARSVVGVELNPITVELGRGLLADYNGNIFNRDDVRVVAAEGRSYLRSSDERFDLIEINGVDTFSALTTGAYVLSESYLYTADAVGEYLNHLTPQGVFAMAMADLEGAGPRARHSIRLASVVRKALRDRGLAHPERHVIVVASRETPALTHTLVRNEPFTAAEIAAVDDYAEELGFRLVHRPDRPLPASPHAVILWGPDTARQALYEISPINLEATTDESPFFFSFSKWSALVRPRASESGTEPAHDLPRGMSTDQKVLLLMLVQAIASSLLLIVGPLLRLRPALRGVPRVGGYLGYFVALGLGFMFIEISFIQRFTLFLGYPTYALTVILFALLVFAGVGSYRTAGVDSPAAVRRLLTRLVLLVLAYLVLLPHLFGAFLGSALGLRIALTIVLMLPLGLLLGGFFPLGIGRVRRRHAALVPWAWAANGCASVVGTITAVMLATAWSFRFVTVAALVVYAAGVAALAWADAAPTGGGEGFAAPGP